MSATEEGAGGDRPESLAEAGYDRAVDAAKREVEVQRELNEQIGHNREEHRRAWEGTEVADVHRQQQEANRIMHLRTPEATEAIGAKPGDPLKGPAS